MLHNEFSGSIVETAVDVHRRLGPGLLESVYQEVMLYELVSDLTQRRRDRGGRGGGETNILRSHSINRVLSVAQHPYPPLRSPRLCVMFLAPLSIQQAHRRWAQ